ncbi:restriction endonuclease subunit S [Crateriforma conspicua]|uniref:restriction endonuclease subunit S n=1 Tax=Crateriforma conspicua TaxID=2527996 RepID=UPI0013FCFCCC|nr:restriction endonuclease subunit S [Crateriforma conspicua]
MYPGKNTAEGVPLVKVSDVKNGRVLGEPDFLISAKKDDEYRRTRLSGNELLITLVGNPGDCALVSEEMADWNVARAIAVVRLENPELRRWVRLALLSHPAQQFMNSRFNTTVQRTLNLKDIREVVVPIPPDNVREGITELASIIDDKIDLNRRMNETLESMARALFKSWFVDFDPVIDNALAAGHSIPEPLAARAETRRALGPARKPLPENIRSLFPATFAFDEEMGWIPEGWDVKPLEDSMEAIIDYRGKTPKKTTSGVPLITAKIVKGGRILPPQEYIAIEDYDTWMRRGIPERDDVVMTTEAPLGEVAQLDGRKVALAQRIITLRGEPTLLHNSYLRFLLQSPQFQHDLRGHATGTTVIGIKQSQLRTIQLLLPSVELQNAFGDSVVPLTNRISENWQSTAVLSKLRDTLLPKLLSGELRIPEAEKLVAESV